MKDLSQRSLKHAPRPFTALEGEKVADRPDEGSTCDRSFSKSLHSVVTCREFPVQLTRIKPHATSIHP